MEIPAKVEETKLEPEEDIEKGKRESQGAQ
jgi:hypothetical protein